MADTPIAALTPLTGAAIVFGALLFVPMTTAAAQQRPSRAQSADSRMVVIHLNGRPFVEGIAVKNATGEEIVVPVAELARAVDGRAAALSDSSRLRFDGARTTLFAARAGGCRECPARVARAVVISTRVRTVDEAAVLPLVDLVAAFEGRLEIDSTRKHYSIHAGRCTWCILEPSPTPSTKWD